ncbi:ABC transporter permease [Cellulomonas sp. MW9]|uniref:ABC transporter permease n=2 Tax=Cellulomonas edaphi TaxID=3053468 RepID=A0ABT7S2F6_9CELL|nr:ABC transporter permease [Cellulomons edaphi]
MSPVAIDDTVPASGRAPRSGTWRLTWQGVRTVAQLELRQRVRSTRWVVALVVWFVVVGGLTLLLSGALSSETMGSETETGPLMFGAVVYLVLGLGLLVTPTLTSTTVNGDRNAGTLATLQVTLLSPAEIALGKLAAAWLAACVFLLISVPFLVLALFRGNTPPSALLRVVVIVALLLAAVCGIGLGFSALVSRTAGSTVLTFMSVAALVLLTPTLFGLTFPSITQEEQVTVWAPPASWNYDGQPECELTTQTRDVSHTERTWWLLGINPFVVVADGAGTRPTPPPDDTGGGTADPLGSIRDGVRDLRSPDKVLDECWMYGEGTAPAAPDRHTPGPVWPWGLAANLLLGVVGFVVAVRRLTIPSRKLPRGTRVA